MSEKTSHQQTIETSPINVLERRSFIDKLGLFIPNKNSIFAQATQSVAYFLKMPICILDILVDEEFLIQSSFGLFNIGLMNDLTRNNKIPKANSLSLQVMETQQPLIIENIEKDSPFSQHILTQEYGISSYLGVPLISPEGICIGTLGVMDLTPHSFSSQDVHFLTMTARWSLMEYIYHQEKESNFENNLSLQQDSNSIQNIGENSNLINEVKLELLEYFTQELKMPVTSIMGMARVLKQEIYGKVTEKQKKYLEVIYDSGQYLISLVDEVMKLGEKKYNKEINLTTFDVEMLCQQVINNVQYIAQHYKQKIKLTIEPGKRLWSLDKEKIQASLFYLILSFLESAKPEGEIRLHFSRKKHSLNFTVWSSHPWLDDSLPSTSIHVNIFQHCLKLTSHYHQINPVSFDHNDLVQRHCFVTTSHLQSLLSTGENNKEYRQLLELFLSCYWIESPKGKMLINWFSDLGYRYVLTLPTVD